MKRIYIILIMCSLTITNYAQTQQGMVKTRGRIVNGVLQPGKGLGSATVTIKGRNAVQSQPNGTFSFPVPTQTFIVQSVKKNGYQLLDIDAYRSYKHSSTPLYLVMETPEQQMQEKLEAERKIRRTLQRQLQKREDELENLKAQNKLSQEEYNKAMQELYDNQQSNEKFIADMAKEYSQLDYDQMDSQNRRISDAILNGRLAEADSLLRSKGDLNVRAEELRRQQKSNAQVRDDLEKSEALAEIKLKNLAEDCYRRFDICKLENKFDSAVHYIELRAQLDSTNIEWQFAAATFLAQQNHLDKAESYYQRILHLCTKETESMMIIAAKASTLNNLAMLYDQKGLKEASTKSYLESLHLRQNLAKENAEEFSPLVAQTLNNLGILYMENGNLDEGEKMLFEAYTILENLKTEGLSFYLPIMASIQYNLACLYLNEGDYKRSEPIFQKVLSVYRKLTEENPMHYQADIAATLSNLLLVYFNLEEFEKCSKYYTEALHLYAQLTQKNPQAFEPYQNSLIANLMRMGTKMNSKAYALENSGNLDGATKLYRESLSIYQILNDMQHGQYNSFVAREWGNLSFNSILKGAFEEAETFARNGLTLDMSKDFIYVNLAEALLLQGKRKEAEKVIANKRNSLKDLFLKDFTQLSQLIVIPEKTQNDIELFKQFLLSE